MSRRLPDTPWFIKCLSREEGDPRRNKARCIYNEDGRCMNTHSDCCFTTCGGSSHCSEYAERFVDHEMLLEERKRINDANRQNIEKYKVMIDNENKEILLCHEPVSDLKRCMRCGGGLGIVSDSAKQCPYCKMYYINIHETSINELMSIAEENDVLLY